MCDHGDASDIEVNAASNSSSERHADRGTILQAAVRSFSKSGSPEKERAM